MSANEWAAAIIESLVQQGVSDFFIAPGSRSTPLVLAAAHHNQTKTYTHFDERGLGFLALGWAMRKKKPAAIIVTSGTAVGNLLPSIMEAHQSYLPLIILSADRPPELRSSGANQTTPQAHIFTSWTQFNTDLLCDGPLGISEVHSLFAQGVNEARKGPVHFNLMFRGPFENLPFDFPNLKKIRFASASHSIFNVALKGKGVILIGRTYEDPTPIYALSERLGWPIFADLLSQRIPHPNQICYYQESLPDEIDFVLQFGDRFISKKTIEWIEQREPEHVLVLPHDRYHDPSHTVTQRITSSIESFCNMFSNSEKRDNEWLSSFQQQDLFYKQTIDNYFSREKTLTEARFLWALAKEPEVEGSLLFIGNSMPIRNGDRFFHPEKNPKAIFANRGVSGIDGNIATIAGISIKEESPVIGIIGDQTALYDLNSLALLKHCPNCTLIIINNQGGAIFSYLPISSSPHCDSYFFNPHSFDFSSAAQQFDLPYRSINELKDFSIEPGILEICTHRETDRNVLQELQLRLTDPPVHA